MSSTNFFVGQNFKTKEEILTFFRDFCSIYLQPLTIRNSSEERVVFKCCHGRRRKSQCTGQRPNQHYLYKGCNAQINIYKGKRDHWLVTKVDLQHNHEIGRAQYNFYGRRRKLEGQDYKLMADLVKARAKNSMIADVLRNKCNKFLTLKDIKNIRGKLFSLCPEEKGEELIKDFLMKIVEENGTCTINYNDDGSVKALFIASEIMIDSLKKSQPQVLQIDASFGFDTENYKLLTFCYYSSVTAKSEFGALAFILRESSEIIRDCLIEFRKICLNDPLAFLINKDFTEVSALKDVFPLSVVLLCEFDVLKYMQKLLSTAFACHSATKESVFQMFEKVLYSQTEEEYEEKKIDLLIIANGVEVRIQDNEYVPFNNEFNNNWNSCKEMWVHCYRKNLPLMGDYTNNRLEESFRTLKNYINISFFGIPSIYEFIIGLVDFVTKRLNNTITSTTQKVFEIMDKNPKIRTSLDTASLRLNETGLRLFQKSLVALWSCKSVKPVHKEGVLETCKLYSTNINSCKCDDWNSYEAPCQHILLLREVLNIELYSDDCFHERYFNTGNNDTNAALEERLCVKAIAPNDINDSDSNTTRKEGDEEVKTSTAEERFNTVSAVTQDLAEVLCAQSTEKFLEYIETLKNFIRLVGQGEPIELVSQPLETCKLRKESESPEGTHSDEGQNFMLRFKEKVKYKARPKRKSRQLT